MNVLQLASELVSAGWTEDRRTVILAARFYLGLDSKEDLNRYLSVIVVDYIVEMR